MSDGSSEGERRMALHRRELEARIAEQDEEIARLRAAMERRECGHWVHELLFLCPVCAANEREQRQRLIAERAMDDRDHWRAEHDRIVGVFEVDHHEQCSKRRQAERERDRWKRRALGLLCRVRELRQMWRTANRTVGRQYRALQDVATERDYNDQARDAWAERAIAEACRADHGDPDCEIDLPGPPLQIAAGKPIKVRVRKEQGQSETRAAHAINTAVGGLDDRSDEH